MAFRCFIPVVVMCAAVTASAAAQHDQDGHVTKTELPAKQAALPPAKTATGPHGGQLQQIESLQAELLVDHGGLRLFFYDPQGQPIDVRKVRGLATLRAAGDAKRYRYDLFAEIGRDKTAISVAAVVDLRRFAGKQLDVTFQLVGVPGARRQRVKFSSKASAPMTETQQVAAAIAAQGTCPVSHQRLGSMGEPIAVSLGDQVVYVCCAGCIDALKANPQKYLVERPPLSGSTKPTVVKATATDARFVAIQKLCPVMNELLDAMGGPYKTVVEGRIVYICCPGCAKKLHDTPATYLRKLAKRGVVPPMDR